MVRPSSSPMLPPWLSFTNTQGIVEDWPDGYGPSSQDVLIPAFVAAYSGTTPSRQSLNPFPRIPMPNWNLNFNGFTKIRWIKRTIFY